MSVIFLSHPHQCWLYQTYNTTVNDGKGQEKNIVSFTKCPRILSQVCTHQLALSRVAAHGFHLARITQQGDLFCFRLDEISGAASKEFGLEKAMERMKVEWKDMYFEFIPYRDTVSSAHEKKCC